MTEPTKRETPTSRSLQGPLEAFGGTWRPLASRRPLKALKNSEKPSQVLGLRRPLEAPCSGAMALFKSLKKSGNVGRQPEKEQSWADACASLGRINQHTNSWFVGHERCAVARYAAAPTSLGVSGRHFSCYIQPPRRALNP